MTSRCLLTFSTCCICVFLCFFDRAASDSTENDKDLMVVTIATHDNDALQRFLSSAKKYNVDVKVLGRGLEWDGGDIANNPGGGQKINILKAGLDEFKDRADLIIMFSDSYDVVITETAEEILTRYRKLNAHVLFSAEGFCWPDRNLAVNYPQVKTHEKRYLNSGGFMGPAKSIYEIVNYKNVDNKDDDQLYYTKIFLDENLRNKWDMKLDVRSEIFQNLNGALSEVTIKYVGSHSYLYNIKTGHSPAVIHGNGPIKPEFNRIANYLGDGWSPTIGCQSCDEGLIDLDSEKDEDYPTVLFAVFIHQLTPFLEEFLDKVQKMNYPKQKIDLYLHNMMEFHNDDVDKFLKETQDDYNSVTLVQPKDDLKPAVGKNWALEAAIKKNSKYLFLLDSVAQISNDNTLMSLVEQNRSVIAPMLVRYEKLWSNFWGALSENGYYARSEDYLEIVDYTKKGLWNVPYASAAILIQGHVLPSIQGAFESNRNLDPDMSLCAKLRQINTFIYVTNRVYFGNLMDTEEFGVHKMNLGQIFANPLEWHERYIHKNYTEIIKEDTDIETPCPDVYWFPIVTERFCDELVGTMETHNTWSDGQNDDPRLSGGYENVPTIDIHMNQVGLEPMWLQFLRVYVSAVQRKVFTGYFHDPPTAIMNFVVRYKPDEQPLLRPHHDASTFTTNIALNHHDEFVGGGCRFIRYDCKVTKTRKGWMMMHPGRLTHYHEGLRVTKGTRYIMVSFVDP